MEVNAMREVDPGQARRLMQEGATLLDVRELNEWQMGRAPEAIHVPLSEVDTARVPGVGLVLAICRSGRRSAQAVSQLSAAGREAINVSGGMLAWRDAGLPVTTDEGARGEIV
jgi:rhodanese-related sulfurtransferase